LRPCAAPYAQKNPVSLLTNGIVYIELSARAAFAALVAAMSMLFIATAALRAIFCILVIHLVHPPFAKDLLHKNYYFQVIENLCIHFWKICVIMLLLPKSALVKSPYLCYNVIHRR
jgi:hypothetical protein